MPPDLAVLERPADPRARSRVWLATGVAAALGAFITISVTVPATRLHTLASINLVMGIPPATTTPPHPRATNAPIPPTAAAPMSSRSRPDDPAVHSSGSVPLSTTNTWGLSLWSEGNWFAAPTAELTVTNGVLAAANGAGITRAGTRPPSHSECRDRNNSGPYPLSALPSGTHVCVKTREGRTGYVRIDHTPGSVLCTGVVWRHR